KSTGRPFRPAREIIDWSIKGRSIFGRKKQLAAKTLARIYAGAVKFKWPEPFLVILRNHMAGQSVDGPLPTIAAGGTHIGLAQPIIVKQHFRRDSQSVDEPAPTVTAVRGRIRSTRRHRPRTATAAAISSSRSCCRRRPVARRAPRASRCPRRP